MIDYFFSQNATYWIETREKIVRNASRSILYIYKKKVELFGKLELNKVLLGSGFELCVNEKNES